MPLLSTMGASRHFILKPPAPSLAGATMQSGAPSGRCSNRSSDHIIVLSNLTYLHLTYSPFGFEQR